ncbi:diphosphomevalonate decarboxylase [Brachybacterium hainanense]|uniref:diphosphomevalonate decarboxylase n=1 Tax=Brachybacterium hainanense TaxID=1541174 RepID=A0ABV6R7Q6_9MICO
MTIEATARAHPNMALVKYWGKRDEQLMLPSTGSLSMTLDEFPTTTTVRLRTDGGPDVLELNGVVAGGDAAARVTRFLDLVRERAGSEARAIVRSRNEVPTGAGLASSASGFAALATAASAVYELPQDTTSRSRLARRGSGSACRSIIDRMAVWHAGTDDESSYAERIDAPELAMVVVVLDSGRKKVSSREAMRLTAATSPFAAAWRESTARTLEDMLAACREGDVTRIGELAEVNALRMHAVIQSTSPSVRYLSGRSLDVFDGIESLRADGIGVWGTADAGPNVVAITRPADAAAVAEALTSHGEVRVVRPGPGARLLEDPADAVPAATAGSEAR